MDEELIVKGENNSSYYSNSLPKKFLSGGMQINMSVIESWIINDFINSYSVNILLNLGMHITSTLNAVDYTAKYSGGS